MFLVWLVYVFLSATPPSPLTSIPFTFALSEELKNHPPPGGGVSVHATLPDPNSRCWNVLVSGIVAPNSSVRFSLPVAVQTPARSTFSLSLLTDSLYDSQNHWVNSLRLEMAWVRPCLRSHVYTLSQRSVGFIVVAPP